MAVVRRPPADYMDLTRQGRGDWYASLDYGTRVLASDAA